MARWAGDSAVPLDGKMTSAELAALVEDCDNGLETRLAGMSAARFCLPGTRRQLALPRRSST
jgi:hypothetical protein